MYFPGKSQPNITFASM